jgi:NhaA family Na+:H+ antiporter
VHATIAGVVMGFLTPAWPLFRPLEYPAFANRLVGEVSQRLGDGVLTHEEHALNHGTLREIRRLSLETLAPLDRIEYRLSSWSAFFIVPVFAFANAGLAIPRVSPLDWLSDPVVLGVGLGLVIGKTIGVFCAAWLAAKVGIARMPPDLTNVHLLGVSICAGVGFTVAMFVANLAFADGQYVESAKLGIIVGSVVAGVLGFLTLRITSKAEPTPLD